MEQKASTWLCAHGPSHIKIPHCLQEQGIFHTRITLYAGTAC